MDKNTLVGFVLIGAVLIGFSIYNRPSKEDLERARRYQDSIQAIQKETTAQPQSTPTDSSARYEVRTDSTSAFYHEIGRAHV